MDEIDTCIKPSKILSVFCGRGLPAWSTLKHRCNFYFIHFSSRRTMSPLKNISRREVAWDLVFHSRIIRRMMCESMLSTNAEITPMHCCLCEPDCLAGIILLFKTNWHLTCRDVRGLSFNSCSPPWCTSSHDECLATTMVWSRPLKNNIKFGINYLSWPTLDQRFQNQTQVPQI